MMPLRSHPFSSPGNSALPDRSTAPFARRHALNSSVSFLLLLIVLGLCLASGNTFAQVPDSPAHADIRTNLQEILRRPEFQPESPHKNPIEKQLNDLRERIEKAWKQFTDWLQKLFRRRGGGMGAVGTGLAYTLIGILIALGAWALARIISVWLKTRTPAPPKTAAVAAKPVESEPEALPASEWIAVAARHAAERDFRAAFRAVFQAILMDLDRTGKISYARSRTNGDYLSLLRTDNLVALYRLLAPLAREFDLHWYGHRPATEADYQRSLATYQSLTALPAEPQEAPQRSSSDSPAAGGTV